MDFRMTEEQELLLDGLRELMERECSEDYIKQCDAEGARPWSFTRPWWTTATVCWAARNPSAARRWTTSRSCW